MQFTLNPYFAVPIIVIAGLTSIGLWYVFVRPVEQVTGTGTIIDRQFQEAQNVEKTDVRAFRGPEYVSRHSKYKLPDRFVYQIKIDGLNEHAHHTVPSASNRKLEVGERVKITYLRRELPFIWSKIYAVKVDPIP
jgi:hypothetical protein